jgi:hypothetical protein
MPGKTAELKFIERTGNVSDQFLEKISETLVSGIVQELIEGIPSLPHFLLIAPDRTTAGVRYTLYVEGVARARNHKAPRFATQKEPHYALCRDLGQLQEPGSSLSAPAVTKLSHENYRKVNARPRGLPPAVARTTISGFEPHSKSRARELISAA